MRDFLAATRDRVVVFDGGMGATLEQFDLSLEHDYRLPGRCHEALVLNRPDVIQGVHESMVEAGAEVVETDTFQASRLKLDEWGLGEHTLEINRRAAEIARAAVGEQRFVAGSIGPTGFLPASEDPTLGTDPLPRARRGVRRAGAGPARGRRRPDHHRDRAGHPRGQGRDLRRPRGVHGSPAARTPIQASVSLLPNGGKMLLGTDISAALATLEALKVDVIGLNCSTGPEDMRDAIRFLGEHSPVPVQLHPERRHPAPGPERRDDLPRAAGPARRRRSATFVDRYGVSIVGGCCGTTPEHIRAIHERCAGHKIGRAARAARAARLLDDRRRAARAGAARRRWSASASTRRARARPRSCCSPTTTTASLQVAEDQVEGGAHVLDLCVALTERQDEDEQMRRVAKKVSLTQPAPIQIDSTEPEVIETALEQIPGRAIVNSINLEAGRDKLDRVVPIAMEHGAALIALTIDEVGMAKTARAQARDRQAHRRAGLRRARHGPRAADLRRADVHADDRRRRVEAVARSRRSRASG